MNSRVITKENKEEIANRIKQIRLQRNFDINEFAAILYVSPFSIKQWEEGKRIPNLEKIKLIAFIFKTTPEWLLYGEWKNEQ